MYTDILYPLLSMSKVNHLEISSDYTSTHGSVVSVLDVLMCPCCEFESCICSVPWSVGTVPCSLSVWLPCEIQG